MKTLNCFTTSTFYIFVSLFSKLLLEIWGWLICESQSKRAWFGGISRGVGMWDRSLAVRPQGPGGGGFWLWASVPCPSWEVGWAEDLAVPFQLGNVRSNELPRMLSESEWWVCADLWKKAALSNLPSDSWFTYLWCAILKLYCVVKLYIDFISSLK